MGKELLRVVGPESLTSLPLQGLPIHATVLFKPEDREFRSRLFETAMPLDRLTGRDVGLFAILGVPAGWRGRQLGLLETATTTGLTLENRVLVFELARRFEVDWESLPVLIASTDIWHGDFVVAPTAPDRLEPQMAALVRAARMAHHHDRHVRSEDVVGALWSVAEGQEILLRRRTAVSRSLDPSFRWLPEPSRDRMEKEAGAALFEAAARALPPPPLPPLPEGVEEATALWREYAYTLRRFIQANPPAYPLDFSPAAVPSRRALEREVNLSLVEAVRCARGVPMPEFFAGRHYPLLPPGRGKVKTGQHEYRINPPVWKNLSLGDVYHVFRTVRAEPGSPLDSVLLRGFPQSDFPDGLLERIMDVNRICNLAVHEGPTPFSLETLDDLLGQAFTEDLLAPLVRLKMALRDGPGGPPA